MLDLFSDDPIMKETCSKGAMSTAGQLLGYTFKVGMELDVCLFFVFMGTLVALNSYKRRNGIPAVVVDVLSSILLLYSSYSRTVIIRNTELTKWVINFCAKGAEALIYNYLVLSVVSWVASSVLEFSSSLNLAKLYKTQQRRLIVRFPNIEWSPSRFIVLATATFCTGISLALTFVLWGFVQRSLGSLAQDAVVLVFLTVAAFLRLTRQLMEGVTLITGIATKEFKWRNPNSKILFGRIAFSSFVLLIHSSCLTYTFASEEKKVWGIAQYTIFMGLCVDVIFRLFACSWATLNSCCVSRLANFLAHSHYHTPTILTHVVNIGGFVVHFWGLLTHTFVPTLVCRFICPSVRFIFVRIPRVVCVAVVVIVTQFAVACQAYILHWQDEEEQVNYYDDPLLEPYLPRQVRVETVTSPMHRELVCAPVILIPTGYRDHRACANCSELAARHHLARSSDGLRHGLVLPFPPCLGGDELPPVRSPTLDFADPTDVGTPFSHCHLEVKCVNKLMPMPTTDSMVVTGHLHSPISPSL
jgi:hypothetical protein